MTWNLKVLSCDVVHLFHDFLAKVEKESRVLIGGKVIAAAVITEATDIVMFCCYCAEPYFVI